jgi:hypothetical protein
MEYSKAEAYPQLKMQAVQIKDSACTYFIWDRKQAYQPANCF